MGPGEQLDLGSAGLQGVPRRLFACTPTRLTTWSDCPRRYRFAYADRPPPAKGPPWAHNSFGATVHTALRGWFDLPAAGREPAAAGGLVDTAWVGDGYRDKVQEMEARARARAMVVAYVRTQAPAGDPRGVERTVAFRTDRLAVSGRVDRIDERPSRTGDGSVELVVVDYKAGRQPPGVDDARGSLALALYVLGARATLRASCQRVELHHVPSGAVAAWDHTEESLRRHLRRAQAIADEAQAADERYAAARRSAAAQQAEPAAQQAEQAAQQAEQEPGGAAAAGADALADRLYPARPGSLCGWCDFVRRCPQGLAAAQPHEPWDALPAGPAPAEGLGGLPGGEQSDDWDATERP